jgi:hypothetical protein
VELLRAHDAISEPRGVLNTAEMMARKAESSIRIVFANAILDATEKSFDGR